MGFTYRIIPPSPEMEFSFYKRCVLGKYYMSHRTMIEYDTGTPNCCPRIPMISPGAKDLRFWWNLALSCPDNSIILVRFASKKKWKRKKKETESRYEATLEYSILPSHLLSKLLIEPSATRMDTLRGTRFKTTTCAPSPSPIPSMIALLFHLYHRWKLTSSITSKLVYLLS